MTPEQALARLERPGVKPEPTASSPPCPPELTTREVEVLRLVAEGLTDA
jgi:DNA-binding NarL/FixJ family response regulator